MAEQFFPVPLRRIVVDTVPNFDLFIRQKDRYVLYRKANIKFERTFLNNLIENKIESLYVSKADLKLYEKYREDIRVEQERTAKSKGFSGIFIDPGEITRYHEILDNYHVVDRHLFEPGQSLTFPVFYHENNDIYLAEDFEGRPEGPWELTLESFSKDLELLIRNEDKPAYRMFVQGLMTDLKAGPVEHQATALREMSKMVVKDVLDDPRSGESIKSANTSVQGLVEFIMENDASFYSLMKISGHDYYTYVHSMNVCTFCIGLGTAIGLPKSPDLELLGLGAMLHDVGKSLVDPLLINKPGRLTDEEFQKMKDHVLLGVNILKENHELPDRVYEPVAQHHEKMTGIGYPYGLKDDQITQFGRISSIVDIYDALTTERSYKKALSPFEALSFLSKTQKDYDNNLLTQFILMLGKQIEQKAKTY
ncbi:MAG: hypothetical protein A3F83_12630 [Candidatus Glassbacteria bacterium RIFCSPLOWO2_12_FULL_58_11]|uniref:HD-GYP domain-containing protein n=1 Tax=Candidatus Glassbacteria bacterium RIFCSPLOWO2_12_FULL_58_11 TaxID=1817867 RepID=A0A1F5YTI0_9BACT|nr:MAG: hypothetical protein A3F83_12630 [Candidatus Glassbacteria bacterium RIFCSPLOWO2_12_FULL_58_11]